MDDISTDDTIITMLIKAARIQLENYCNLSFGLREVTATIQNSLGNYVLPMQPIIGDVAIVDKDGTTVESLELPNDYLVCTYDAGYATLPSDLKTAILMQLAFLYANRGNADSGAFSPMALQIANQYRNVLC